MPGKQSLKIDVYFKIQPARGCILYAFYKTHGGIGVYHLISRHIVAHMIRRPFEGPVFPVYR